MCCLAMSVPQVHLIADLTGSYRDAFLNGTLWNAVNIAIIAWLFLRSPATHDESNACRGASPAAPPAAEALTNTRPNLRATCGSR